MIRKVVIGVALIGVLSGCSTIKEMYTDYPKKVAVAEASLATLERTALIYVSLPSCVKHTTPICRDPDVTKSIRMYDDIAFNAVTEAKKAQDETKLEAAFSAINVLKTITDKLPVH